LIGGGVIMVVFCHYIVRARWFMNMFWGVNIVLKGKRWMIFILKGEEVDNMFWGVWKVMFSQA
jgi:hypothetical protein